MKSTFVYIISNKTNGNIYVGCSHNPRERFYKHYTDIRSAGKDIHKAMVREGPDNFQLEIVKKYSSRKAALEGETETILALRAEGRVLYNLTDGGLGSLNRKVSEDTKRKIANSVTGFRHSDETKNKMSHIRMGKKTGKYYGKPAEYIQVVCAGCGKTFSRLACKERFRAKKRGAGPFCSFSCRNRSAAYKKHHSKR